MLSLRKTLCLTLGACAFADALPGGDLTIHQPDSATFDRKTVQYSCDATGRKIGVPGGIFAVEYINGGGNSLVVVPIGSN